MITWKRAERTTRDLRWVQLGFRLVTQGGGVLPIDDGDGSKNVTFQIN